MWTTVHCMIRNPFSFDFEVDDLDYSIGNGSVFVEAKERCQRALHEYGLAYHPELVRIIPGDYNCHTRMRQCRLEYDVDLQEGR